MEEFKLSDELKQSVEIENVDDSEEEAGEYGNGEKLVIEEMILLINEKLCSGDLNETSQAIIDLEYLVHNNPDQISNFFNEIQQFDTLSMFINNFNRELTHKAMYILEEFIVYNENQEIFQIFCNSRIIPAFVHILQSNIHINFASHIISLLLDLITKFSPIISVLNEQNVTSTVLDTLNALCIDKNPVRIKENCRTLPFVRDKSINSTDYVKLKNICIDYIKEILVYSESWDNCIYMEGLCYILLFVNQMNIYALDAVNVLLREASSDKLQIHFVQNFINCGSANNIVIFAAKNYTNGWRVIVETLKYPEITVKYLECGLMNLISEFLQNPEIGNTDAVLISLQTLTFNNYEDFCLNLANSPLLDQILEYLQFGATENKVLAVVIVSNIMFHGFINEVMKKCPDFAIIALNLINIAKPSEATTIVNSLHLVAQEASKNNMDLPTVFGGEEGFDLIDEILENEEINVYDDLLHLNEIVFENEEASK